MERETCGVRRLIGLEGMFVGGNGMENVVVGVWGICLWEVILWEQLEFGVG